MKYSNDSTLGVARQQYFARSGFDERGYADKWIQLKAGPISFYFPNTQARVRAVKLHDLHHVLTEYDTNWRGEAEIGAWEIASGCGRYLAAWALNLGAFGLGLALAPRRVYRAFLRGRQTGNLYSGEFAEWLLSKAGGRDPKRVAAGPIAGRAVMARQNSIHMLGCGCGSDVRRPVFVRACARRVGNSRLDGLI